MCFSPALLEMGVRRTRWALWAPPVSSYLRTGPVRGPGARLEQRPQHAIGPRPQWRSVAVKERGRGETEQSCGERRIGEVVLGSASEASQQAAARLPRRDRVEQTQ